MTYGMTLLSGALVAIALAVHQTPQPIVRKPLLDAVIAPEKMVHTAKMVSIDFAPAQKTGAHRHPIPVVGYVVKGSITFQIEGQAARTLMAGEAFFEPADAKIVAFDNASKNEPASFVACYLMGAADQQLITMLPD